MLDMPRPRPPFLQRQRTQHGRFVWYFRRPGGKRTRLRAKYGTPEFDAEYEAAKSGTPLLPSKAAREATGSLSWLWTRYRETGSWTILGAGTRRQRENIMVHVIEKAGHEPYGAIRPTHVLAGRDARAATPSQAKGFLVIMRAMFRWALSANLVKEDPTVGIKAFPKPKNGGFPVWTENDVDRYCAHWPIGTKERVWLDVLLYTGLRRGDVVTIGRQHIRRERVTEMTPSGPRTIEMDVATLLTEKSQGTMTVTLPILPILAATIAAGPCSDLAFICGAKRKPLKKTSFGNMFREACNAAGVVGKSAHGLRKAGATRSADNGATEQQLNSIFGWETGSGMAAIYTEAANRKRASMLAMGTMARTPDEHPIPSPDDLVRVPVRIVM
jgi:integrase